MAGKEINFTISLRLCTFCSARGVHMHSYRELTRLFRGIPEERRNAIWQDYTTARNNYWDWNNFVISIMAYYAWIARQREMDARAGITE